MVNAAIASGVFNGTDYDADMKWFDDERLEGADMRKFGGALVRYIQTVKKVNALSFLFWTWAELEGVSLEKKDPIDPKSPYDPW